MKLFIKQRENLGEFIVSRKNSKTPRHAKVYNFMHALTIGIIFKVENADQIKYLKEVFKEWKSKDKKIYAFGYVDSQKINGLASDLKHINVITRQHFNLFFIPKGDICDKFMNTSFDILINADLSGNNAIHHLCGLSKAQFKVGSHSSKSYPYDLMLNLNNNLNLRYFIEQVENYLAML